MKRRSILLVLLLLLFICICCGCADSSESAELMDKTTLESAVITEETAVEIIETEEALLDSAPAEDTEQIILEEQKSSTNVTVEDTTGIFEGLEDNHTAVFSFDGAETAFYFEDDAVRNVLYEAVSGSTYTLSYHYDDSFGYIIHKISE